MQFSEGQEGRIPERRLPGAAVLTALAPVSRSEASESRAQPSCSLQEPGGAPGGRTDQVPVRAVLVRMRLPSQKGDSSVPHCPTEWARVHLGSPSSGALWTGRP